MKKTSGRFVAAGILAILISTGAFAEDGYWHGNPTADSAVLYPFANVSDLKTMADGPVKQTCSNYVAPPVNTSATNTSATKTKPITDDEQVKLADGVTKELDKRLSKKIIVTVARPSDVPAVGSLVFTGCFVGANPGNAGKRLIGVGMGASRLLAHVRVFYVGATGPVPVEEFDVAVKGSNKLPPLGAGGLAFNAISDKGKGLQGDSKRLADDILKRLKKDHRF